MNKENNHAKEGFKKAYELIPAIHQPEVRDRIIRVCEWGSRSTFYAKVKGVTPVKKLERAAISAIFAEHNLDYNGNYIKQLA